MRPDLDAECGMHRRATGCFGCLCHVPGVVHLRHRLLRSESHQLHERVGEDAQSAHQQQRAAADGVVRCKLGPGGGDHPLQQRRVGKQRHHRIREPAPERLPPRDHRRLQQQRELGTRCAHRFPLSSISPQSSPPTHPL